MDRTKDIPIHSEGKISCYFRFCDFKYSLELLSFGPSFEYFKVCNVMIVNVVNSFMKSFFKISMEKMNEKQGTKDS